MKFKIIIILLTVSSVIFSCVWEMFPNPSAVKYDPISFNKLTRDVLSQNQIFQMDDFTRHYKRLNGKYIRLTKEREEDDDYSIFLDSVIDEQKITRNILNNLRIQLEKTKLRDFY